MKRHVWASLCLKTRVGNSLFGFSCESLIFQSIRAKVQFALFKVQIALVSLFVKSIWVICPRHSFSNSGRSECRLLQRARRAMKSNLLFCFGHKKGKSMVKEQIWSESLFIKSQQARHSLLSCHYLRSNGGDSLQSLFFKERIERKSEEQRAKSKRAKSEERKSEERKCERANSQHCSKPPPPW